ncbi:hypothetical protein FB451DRAFT_1395461 [Mycena latifolia]|nr:hypothetical protein FB451DRAFT_1395461 [Mycena latifolia]
MREKRKRREQGTAASLVGESSTHTHAFSLADLNAVDAPIAVFVHHVSEDTRRVYIEELPVEPPSPVKKIRLEQILGGERAALPDNCDVGSIEALDRYQLGIWDGNDMAPPPPSTPPALTKPREVKPADPSLHEWRLHLRDRYLAALLWREGPGDAEMDTCPGCEGKTKLRPLFRCGDCHGGAMYCRSCIVQRHAENPLHRVWKWCELFFVKTSLTALGLRVQLRHAPCRRRPAPEAGHSEFVVLHSNGIHEVKVNFCRYERAIQAGSPEIQLLRAGWFLATDDRPRTCATLDVLNQFHQVTLQAKMNMYDYYGVLEKLTDNTGIKPPDHYHEWIRMCRKYRHIMLLKCCGQAAAYTMMSMGGTAPGELAIECPACPRPGVNLPEGWEKASLEERFLYTLFLALDACFRLKRRLVSSELRNPDLGPGWAYVLDTGPYREYLRTVTDQKEMNTCSGLAALDYVNTKFSRGYSTTGVGMGVCVRHEFIQPNGIGDLQKGKRFANMDYIFASILKHKDAGLFKMISYNIVCIWSKHLVERLKALPSHVRLHIVMALMRFAIPKMHIHSHTLLCQLLFSLNLILGSAQVDGEGVRDQLTLHL